MIVDIVSTCCATAHRRIEATPEANEAWREHVAALVAPPLFGKAKSWYIRTNIPGKSIQSLIYPGGLLMYGRQPTI